MENIKSTFQIASTSGNPCVTTKPTDTLSNCVNVLDLLENATISRIQSNLPCSNADLMGQVLILDMVKDAIELAIDKLRKASPEGSESNLVTDKAFAHEAMISFQEPHAASDVLEKTLSKSWFRSIHGISNWRLKAIIIVVISLSFVIAYSDRLLILLTQTKNPVESVVTIPTSIPISKFPEVPEIKPVEKTESETKPTFLNSIMAPPATSQEVESVNKKHEILDDFQPPKKIAPPQEQEQNRKQMQEGVKNVVAQEEHKKARKSEEPEDSIDQYLLGKKYEKGQGVPQNYQEAAKWYRKAAEQGIAQAQDNLGKMYYKGQGVPHDYKEAMKWFRKAAEQGYASAQNILGIMYGIGDGVPQDYVKALMWINLADSQGNQDGSKARDTLLKSMTPAQITKAQELARNWKPTKP